MTVTTGAITSDTHDQAQSEQDNESSGPTAGRVVQDAEKKGPGRGDEVADGLSHPGQSRGLTGTSGPQALEAQGKP
ncbi:hypothetical protein [Actinosynnema sp. ALI-1.44]|uniref:hypothetical protein n=1 Tax=Actinosynnema sp. ALI-1.44 TaxID=1933779 RepID=UPI00143D77D5|nr:hypothetical protein [Actinosynnema sp. ALI-1.44]